MTYQQLAMSRMRALELDRAVVIAATSGVSAIVLPSGEVTQKTSIFTNGTLVETLPLRIPALLLHVRVSMWSMC